MTEEEIQLVVESLEDGDEVSVVIGEGYYAAGVVGRVRMNRGEFVPILAGRYLYAANLRKIAVLSKGTPKWHRAKVINAEVKGSKNPEYFLRDLENPTGFPWVDVRGDFYSNESLENVFIIVGEDG